MKSRSTLRQPKLRITRVAPQAMARMQAARQARAKQSAGRLMVAGMAAGAAEAFALDPSLFADLAGCEL